MTYRDSKDLARRIAVDRVLRDKACNFENIGKYDGY